MSDFNNVNNNDKDLESNKAESSEINNPNTDKHRMIVCSDGESLYIPNNLVFVPYEFNSGTDIVNTVHNRAAYLMAYLYEYYTYEDATKLMDDLCESLNREINEAINSDSKKFNASYVKPIHEEITNKDSIIDYCGNCGVDWDSFNADFLDFIFDENYGLDNVVNFIFNDNSFVFNNHDYNLTDEDIADMFGILGDSESLCTDEYTII